MPHDSNRTCTAHAERTGLSEPGRDSDLDAEARALHRVLLDLKRAYQFRDRDRACCYEISVAQCWALEVLRRRGPLTLSELAAELYLDKSTASRVVSALERKGFVCRRPHPGDGRAVLLKATAAGIKLYDRIEADMLGEEKRLLAGFEPGVRRSLVELLARLVEGVSLDEVGVGECCNLDLVERGT
jgi:DNA-binding MarR family transcriptional regulator